MSVRSLLVLSKIHKSHTQSTDFIFTFPQAEVKVPIYLHIPQEIIFGEDNDEAVLKLRNNLYGIKDEGRTWWEHLSEDLIDLGFTHTHNFSMLFDY